MACTPILVTIEQVLGGQVSALGGATLAGSDWATYNLGYIDSNSNGAYDIGETIVYDVNLNLVVDSVPGTGNVPRDTGDRIVSVSPTRSPNSAELGSSLRQDKEHIKFLDGTVTRSYNTANGSYDYGETLVFDSDLDGIIGNVDWIVSVSPARPPSSTELGRNLHVATFSLFNKRNQNPPCFITNAKGQVISAFVQINRVQLVNLARYEILDCNTSFTAINGGAPYPDRNGDGSPDELCDTTMNVYTSGQPKNCYSSDKSGCMHRIHTEIDVDWLGAGYCGPATACDDVALRTEISTLTLLDIQGFVYWDPEHTDNLTHSYSGWEIHPLTAWRRSPLPPGEFAWFPTVPLVGQEVRFVGSGTGMSSPTFSWAFGDGGTFVSSTSTALHTFLTAGIFTVSLTVTDSDGNSASKTQQVPVVNSTSASWNPNVSCSPIVMTIEQVRAGAAANPGIPNHRQLNQPCSVFGQQGEQYGTLVQINHLKRGSLSENDWSTTFASVNGGGSYSTGRQSDTAFNIYNPSYSNSCSSSTDQNCFHRLFAEIDRDWKAAGYCGSGSVCDNSTLAGQTTTSTLIDIQGFLRLNPGYSNATWHSLTAWEIHPISAWRISILRISENPSALFIPPGSTATSTISVQSLNGYSGTVSLTASVSPIGPTVYLSASNLNLASGGTGSTILSVESRNSSPGVYAVTVEASIGTTSYSTMISVTIPAQEGNAPPVLDPIGPTNVMETTQLSFSATASDPNVPGQTLTFSLGPSAPAGASITSTGLFTWAPTEAQGPGSYSFTITVADNGVPSLSDSETFTVTVDEANLSPSIRLPGAQSVEVGSTLTFIVEASDADLPVNSVTLSASSLAAGMSFQTVVGNPVSGTFSFTPDANQLGSSFTVAFNAVDDGSPAASTIGTVVIDVVAAQVRASSLVVASDGKVYRYEQGASLTLIGQPTTNSLRSVAWHPSGSYALIVGDKATVIKYDGSQFTIIPTGIGTSVNFYTVAWKSDGSLALIAGSSGTVLAFDGVTVTQVPNTSRSTIRSVSWHPSGVSSLLVGKNGAVLVYENGVMRSVPSGTSSELWTVSWNPNGQYALIAGASGTVLRYDGTAVVPLNTNGLYSSTLVARSVSWNSVGTLALIVGDGGLVVTYDGNSLSRISNTYTSPLYAVAWQEDSATIVGGSGTVLSFSNSTVTRVTSNTTSSLRGIAWKPS